MKIALFSNGLEAGQASDLFLLVNQLLSIVDCDVRLILYKDLAAQFPELLKWPNVTEFRSTADLDTSFTCLISLGGDGTILSAVTLVKDLQIPILGINFGRLGFLASLNRDKIPSISDALRNNNYSIEERTLLHVEASEPLFDDSPFGLNDFAILKKDTSPMIKIHTYIDDEHLNTYWSDGLIVATPTGSTAYNLSGNGPVLFPDASSFVITPIAPHQLSVRPIVIPDSSTIRFEIESRAEQVICSLDSRREVVSRNIKITLRKEKFKARIVKLPDSSFLSTLKSKLSWGLDTRN